MSASNVVIALLIGVIAAGGGCSPSRAPSAAHDDASARTEARVAVPNSYAETCRLVPSWCVPVTGAIPHALRRRLRLPALHAGDRCPTSSGRRIDNGQFGGIAIGRGPVRPLISASGGSQRKGRIPFVRVPGNPSWWHVKTLWFAYPRYQGPVFIRGRQLDRRGKIVFGETPSLSDPQLPPTPTLNGNRGWREWPGATFVRSLGCFAWQVDGRDFSTVIVFEAVPGSR